MSSAVLCAVMLTVAVDYGYEPMPGDGIRYVFQIEPEMLDVLRREPLISTIPPEARGRIHEFRIVSHDGPLSKEIPPLTEKPADITPPPMPPSFPDQPDTGNPPPHEAVPNGGLSRPELPPWPPRVTDNSSTTTPPKVLQASAIETSSPMTSPSEADDQEDPEQPEPAETDPWFLLVLASIVAAGSSSGMLYFGWLAFDYRSRYLGLLRDSMKTDSSWLDDPLDAARQEFMTSDPVDTPVNSEPADQPPSEDSATDDSAWQDLGAETDDSLDDWLKEDGSQGRRSRRNRKKSR